MDMYTCGLASGVMPYPVAVLLRNGLSTAAVYIDVYGCIRERSSKFESGLKQIASEARLPDNKNDPPLV